MALINPTTGSSRFNVIITKQGVVSLASQTPVILSEEETFKMKMLSDAMTGEEISAKDLQEVPDEEIGEDGIWIHAAAAKYKDMSQEELIAYIVKLEAQAKMTSPAFTDESAPVEEPAPVEEAEELTEPAEETEEKPAPKKRSRSRKKTEPKEEAGDETQEIHTDAEDKNADEVDGIEF